MTDITLFRGPLRLMLDDFDPNVRRYADSVLDNGVRTVVRMGLLNRAAGVPAGGFSLTVDGGNISPDLISADAKSPDWYALLCHRVVKLFLDSKPSRYSFGTRAVRESVGDYYHYLETIEAEIQRLENGAVCFGGYQSFFGWTGGLAGLPLGEVLAQMNVGSPLWSATFTRDGMRVA